MTEAVACSDRSPHVSYPGPAPRGKCLRSEAYRRGAAARRRRGCRGEVPLIRRQAPRGPVGGQRCRQRAVYPPATPESQLQHLSTMRRRGASGTQPLGGQPGPPQFTVTANPTTSTAMTPTRIAAARTAKPLVISSFSLKATDSASPSPIHSVSPASSYSGEWRWMGSLVFGVIITAVVTTASSIGRVVDVCVPKGYYMSKGRTHCKRWMS